MTDSGIKCQWVIHENKAVQIDVLKDTYSLPLGWGGPSRLHAIYSPDSGGSHQRLVLSK